MVKKKKKKVTAAVAVSDVKEGDRVKFPSSHNKALELVGKVVKVHEDGDVVDVECEVDGKIIEVEGHIQTVATSDLKVAAEGDEAGHLGNHA